MSAWAFRLYDLHGSVVYVAGSRAWVLFRDQWTPLDAMPVPFAGSILNRNAMRSLTERVGTPC